MVAILTIAVHVTHTVYNVQCKGLVWSPEMKCVRRPSKRVTFILVIPV
jgi:hypothetical protein